MNMQLTGRLTVVLLLVSLAATAAVAAEPVPAKWKSLSPRGLVGEAGRLRSEGLFERENYRLLMQYVGRRHAAASASGKVEIKEWVVVASALSRDLPARTRQANRRETERLIGRLNKEKLDRVEVAKIIRRLGEVGDTRAIKPIIKRIEEKGVHWIVRQDALSTLGRLGGAGAQAILLKVLTRPMPAKAKLEDYGEVEAILRGYAARALGRCGDKSVITILEQVTSDPKQYVRVREASRSALRKLSSRFGKKVSPASKPAGKRIISDEDRRLVLSLIKKLESADVGPHEKADGLRALGFIGGPKAQVFLVKVLTQPMSPKANVSDDVGEDARFRCGAICALIECGDESVIRLLERLADDPRQYQRVRRSCKEALQRLRERM